MHTTRELADLLNTAPWRVARLFEDGPLPEPPRFGGKRAISGDLIPKIVDALRDRGWLPSSADPSSPEPATPAAARSRRSGSAPTKTNSRSA